ncbi:MAG: cysteine-rich CWC family protein [Azoarcus sp.]|nr:cysteine-rich CWC family protein [Azoarcus sp.]
MTGNKGESPLFAPLGGEPKTCPRCGARFHCGAHTGKCWCAALPPLLPVPAPGEAGCYCPDCLAGVLENGQGGF